MLITTALIAPALQMSVEGQPQDVEPVVGVDWFDFTNVSNFVVIAGLMIPVITALVTKKVASSEVKSVVTLLLTTLTAVVGTLVAEDGGWAWRAFGNAFLSAFIPAIAAYYGLWKHSSLTEAINNKTGNFGILVAKDKPSAKDQALIEQAVHDVAPEALVKAIEDERVLVKVEETSDLGMAPDVPDEPLDTPENFPSEHYPAPVVEPDYPEDDAGLAGPMDVRPEVGPGRAGMTSASAWLTNDLSAYRARSEVDAGDLDFDLGPSPEDEDGMHSHG